MPDSVHTARYLSLIGDTGWDLHLFPVYYCEPHAKLRNVTVWNGASSYRPPHVDPSVKVKGLWPFRRGRMIGVHAGSIAARFGWHIEHRLAALIRHIQPDIVHSFEFQLAGYTTLRAKRLMSDQFPLWIATNWGSDIYAYGKLPEHAGMIRELLQAADVYACECLRDVHLAKELGFNGEVMPVVPNTGGFDLEHCVSLKSPEPPSRRKIIAVKGYQYSFGRSLVALRALERIAPLLKDYKIVVYSAYPKDVVWMPARLMAQRTGLDIDLWEQVPHDEILRLHGRARISISLSISDAICTSMTEAMVMGSLPIQSDSACADEWVEDGRSALLVNADDSDAVAAALTQALADDTLVDEAARLNWDTAVNRLDTAGIKTEVLKSYEHVLKRISESGQKVSA